MNVSAGGEFWWGMGKVAVMGAVSGVISLGIGTVATSIFGQEIMSAVMQAGLHGYVGGMMNLANGEEFGSGFASGVISSLVSSGIQGLGKINFNKDPLSNALGYGRYLHETTLKALTIVAGGLSGGISSTIAGGNFWSGMRQGLITAGLNHVMHGMFDPPGDGSSKQKNQLAEELKKVFDNYPTDGNYEITPQEAFSSVSPAAEKAHLSGDSNYQNACATRLSLAFAKAGIKIPSGYGGLKDVNGNRIIISAVQMHKFMSTKYGSLMTNYSDITSKKGIYVGIAKPGMGYSGHATIIKPGFNSKTYFFDMQTTSFWSIK